MLASLRVLVILVSVVVGTFAPTWLLALLTAILVLGTLIFLIGRMAVRALFGSIDSTNGRNGSDWQFFVFTSLFTFYAVVWFLWIVR